MSHNFSTRDVVFCFLFAVFIIVPLLFIDMSERLSMMQGDEVVYKKIVKDWNIYGIEGIRMNNDNKPITFLSIQKVLDGDPNKTRILNLIFIGLNTYLIYRLTHRREALLYVFIPLFLNSMWLTVESIETFFLLLCLRYERFSGIFVGISTLVRPYSILYLPLLKRKQWGYVFLLGASFALLLLYLGLFWQYGTRLITYAGEVSDWRYSDYLAMLLWLPMLYMGSAGKNVAFKFGLIASIPLLLRQFGHYFITPYSMFFVAYLVESLRKEVEVVLSQRPRNELQGMD